MRVSSKCLFSILRGTDLCTDSCHDSSNVLTISCWCQRTTVLNVQLEPNPKRFSELHVICMIRWPRHSRVLFRNECVVIMLWVRAMICSCEHKDGLMALICDTMPTILRMEKCETPKRVLPTPNQLICMHKLSSS